MLAPLLPMTALHCCRHRARRCYLLLTLFTTSEDINPYQTGLGFRNPIGLAFSYLEVA